MRGDTPRSTPAPPAFSAFALDTLSVLAPFMTIRYH